MNLKQKLGLFGLMLLGLTTACKEETEVIIGDPYLEVTPKVIKFSPEGTLLEGETDVIKIKTSNAWGATIEGDNSWLTLSSNGGFGSADVKVSVEAGEGARAYIVIGVPDNKGGLLKETIEVLRGDAPEGPVITEKEITIPEIVGMMTVEGDILDESIDRYFEAIVHTDAGVGKNYEANCLQIAVENATSAKQGIVLLGQEVDAIMNNYKKGDRIKVTLKAGVTFAKINNGRYELSGKDGKLFTNIEKLTEANTITPIEITPDNVDNLIEYQNMTVVANNVTSVAGNTTWGNTPVFNFESGKSFNVYVSDNANFSELELLTGKTGNITGLVVVVDGKAYIAPSTRTDVEEFTSMVSVPIHDGNCESDPIFVNMIKGAQGENGGVNFNCDIKQVQSNDCLQLWDKGSKESSSYYLTDKLGSEIPSEIYFSFYAVPYKNNTTDTGIKIEVINGNISDSGNITTEKSFVLSKDNNVTSGGNISKIVPAENDFFYVKLVNLTSDSQIKITTVADTDKLVVFGMRLDNKRGWQ